MYKTGVTHYFSVQKARDQLGYKPTIQNDLSEVVELYVKAGHKRQPKSPSNHGIMYWTMNVILMCMFGMLIMSVIPIVK